MRLPTQAEYEVGLQKFQNLYAKLRLLNSKGQSLGEWETSVVGNPTFTVDSSSAIRRTCSLTLLSKGKRDFESSVREGKDIWLDTYVQVYLGIKHMRSKEIVYTNMGRYMLDNPREVYSATENTFALKGVDLMCQLTGLRNGVIGGRGQFLTEYVIPEGYNVRRAFIEILEQAGFYNYAIEECQFTVPNELKFSNSNTYYDVLKALLDIDPTMQMYFDVDGVFRYEKTPMGENEQIIVNDDYWQKTLISYSRDYDFEKVKNYVEVIGKTHTIKNYADATVNGSTYNLNIVTITNLYNNTKIGFTAPYKVTNPLIQINSLPIKRLLDYEYDEYGNVVYRDGKPSMIAATLEDRPNVYYVAKYIEADDYFLYMGEVTPVAIEKDEDPNSPFYIGGALGEIKIVLQGGEYENIHTQAQAKKRAQWELYRRCKLTDSIEINTIPILWLDVNSVISISLPRKNSDKEESLRYIITNINTTFGVGGSQTIKASRYYPYYN